MDDWGGEMYKEEKPKWNLQAKYLNIVLKQGVGASYSSYSVTKRFTSKTRVGGQTGEMDKRTLQEYDYYSPTQIHCSHELSHVCQSKPIFQQWRWLVSLSVLHEASIHGVSNCGYTWVGLFVFGFYIFSISGDKNDAMLFEVIIVEQPAFLARYS